MVRAAAQEILMMRFVVDERVDFDERSNRIDDEEEPGRVNGNHVESIIMRRRQLSMAFTSSWYSSMS